MNNKVFGYTLLELMVVIAILAIIAAFAIPSYQNLHRESKFGRSQTADAFISPIGRSAKAG